MIYNPGIKLLATWISFSLLYILFIIFSINYSSIIYSRTYYSENLHSTKARIEDYINFYIDITANLASDRNTVDFLNHKTEQIETDKNLKNENMALLSSKVYIMDTNGDVLSSSDYENINSLKGNNYSFRPYFTEAMKGKPHVMMALGITTGVRGVYYSAPISDDGNIIGVFVIKAGLERIDQIIQHSPVYMDIVSENGKVFSSTEKGWLLVDTSVTDSINSLNTVSTDLLEKSWQLRTIYREKDLMRTPVLIRSIIKVFGFLLYILISFAMLLSYINRRRKIVEIRLKERKREIVRINAGLEEKIKVRTEELKITQKQLIEAEKMAALGNLVAGVSHEINTPIGISLTASTFLSSQINELLNDEVELNKNNLAALKKSTDMIIRNIQRSSDIIRTFKQITGETIVENPLVFNLKDHLEQTIHSISFVKDLKKPEIIINCPENISFSSYPLAFFHIFSNLINNTVIHGFCGSDHEKIEITVNKTGSQLMIIYQDNGSGMVEETRKKIFEPFYTTERGNGGTGLGMHIVYNIIVKLFKGSIICHSRPGRGTSFTLYLSPVLSPENSIST